MVCAEPVAPAKRSILVDPEAPGYLSNGKGQGHAPGEGLPEVEVFRAR